MSIEQTDIVDAIGVQQHSGKLILTISDHLDWNVNIQEHMLLLQEKLNTYLAFVESGELLEQYPDARGRDVIINVVALYPLSLEARRFLDQASAVIADAGITLTEEQFQAS
jgi:hypothetical protein